MDTPHKTRDLGIWWQYLAWQIQYWMMLHKPRIPQPLRTRLTWHYSQGGTKVPFVSRQQMAAWHASRMPVPAWVRVWPWWVGEHFQGPLVPVWDRVARWFRGQTGGRSHRCEFTDPEHGALYGHHEGPFMDRLFAEFLTTIDADDTGD